MRASRPLVLLGLLAAVNVVVGVALLWWFSRDASPQPRWSGAANVNVIVYSVCSLRFDRLSSGLTPYMDAFAKRGVVFDRAYAQGTWTRPSHIALFSGRYAESVVFGPICRLPESSPTFTEALQKAGYETCGILDGKDLAEEFGFSRGFESYSSEPPDRGDFIHMVADGLRWIDARREPQRPFFLFLHSSEVHPAHGPIPCPTEKPYSRDVQDAHALEADCPALMACTWNETFYSLYPHWTFEMPVLQLEEDLARHPERYGGRRLEKGVRDHMVAHYDAAVREVDDAFGQLVDGLQRRGLTDNTLIVLLSDHGWELFDRGRFGHIHHGYDSIAHVPLIVGGPRLAGGTRVGEEVGLIDVAPTLLEYLRLPAQPAHQGRSFAGLMTGKGDAGAARYSVTAVLFGTFLRMGGWELVVTTSPKPAVELYDLKSDTGERRNLYSESGVPANAAAPLAALRDLYKKTQQEMSARAPAGTTPPLTDETRAWLQKRGYW